MKSLHRFTACLCLLVVFGVNQTRAAFTSLYIFGDGASTTTSNTYPGYYGQRYCNGRVWVEVLAQWQNVTYQSSNNSSYYGHYSQNLTNSVNSLVAPADASNALVIVWVNDADLVNNMVNGAYGPPYDNSKLSLWTNSLNNSITNHTAAIQTLYNKGFRTLVMPNAVDITKVPAFAANSTAGKAFIRQRIIEFNNRFTTILSNAVATLPSLKIVKPDVFTLLDNIYSNPTNFGLIFPPLNETHSAIGQGLTVLNGPGAYFMFWDDTHPTAKFQMYIAEQAQQLLSPASISNITSVNTSNQLDMTSLPVGRDGVVEVSTNFLDWATTANVTTTNLNQSVLVNAPGEHGFYRLRFPFLWSWP